MSADAVEVETERFKLEQVRDQVILKLRGDWRLSAGLASPETLFGTKAFGAKPENLKVDATAVSVWDSVLVCFLVNLQQRCAQSGIALDLSDVPAGARKLVELALAVPAREGAARKEGSTGFIEVIGRETLSAVKSAGDMMEFLGESLIALARVASMRARFRPADVLLILQKCGPEALPIVTLISLLVGTILGFVGLVQLQQFGADIYVANLVTVAMVREMGGMMTGIIMAGRTGAAFAAQLGTMQVNDEIAAFRAAGIPAVEFLVLPRMLALILAVPLLTIYSNVVGMLGGSIVTVVLSEISLTQYYAQTLTSVDLIDWSSGLFKATIYGVIIAISGCLRGIQCSKSAAAVGEAATSAVVTAIVFIIVAEAVLTVVYHVLGI